MSVPVPLQAVDELPERVGPPAEAVVLATVSFLIVYSIGRFGVLPAVRRVIRARNRKNPTMVVAIERYTHLAILVSAATAALIGGGYGHVLTRSAIVVAAVTLAVGVAGQAVIGNLVSGLFLAADPDFNVDDWIAWEDREGIVEEIRLRVTRVRTPNHEVVTVPNTTLATSAITRPYARDRFRVVTRVRLPPGVDLDTATRSIRDAVARTQGVIGDPSPRVVVDEFDMEAVCIRLECWIEQPTRPTVRDVRSRIFRRISDRLTAEGISLTPPREHRLSGHVGIDTVSPTELSPDDG